MINSVDGKFVNNAYFQNVAFKSLPVQNGENGKKNKTMSTGSKVAIGASALAAVVVGGLLVHKGIQVNKLNKAISELKSDLLRRMTSCDEVGGKFFDNNILQKHIDDAVALPKKEQLNRLLEINNNIWPRDRNFVKRLSERSIEGLPKNVQEAVASKDQLQATIAYKEYCDTLFHKSKTAGATIQESIENVFGKGSKIKPHTYNPADEAQYLCGYIDMGGYKDLAINSKNEICHRLNHSSNSVIDQVVIDSPDKVFGTMFNSDICKGVYKGKTYVRLNIPNGRTGNQLLFVSKDGTTLTPVQRDLLSLQGKLSKQDMKLFAKMLSNAGPNGLIVTRDDLINGGSHLGFVNYDVILSTIQTLAQKYK